VCYKICSEGRGLVQKSEVSTSNIFYEIMLVEWQGKMDSKFPVHAIILYSKAPTTAILLRDMITGTWYIFLMQFLTIIDRPQTL
jgi:hypothetical protein